MMHIAPRFARHGVMACSMQYRLAHNTLGPIPRCPRSTGFCESSRSIWRIALWDFLPAHIWHCTALSPIHIPSRRWSPLHLPICNPTLQATSPCFSTEHSQASPIPSKREPPTLILHGSADHIHPLEQRTLYCFCNNTSIQSEMEYTAPLAASQWKEGKKAFDWLIKTLDLPLVAKAETRKS